MPANLGPTAQDIINEALGHLGVYQGDPLAASDLQSAFFTLAAILDGWAAQPLTFRQISVSTFTTTAGQQSYTIGPAATNNWVTSFVPQEFSNVGMLLPAAGSPAVEIEVDVATADQWARIGLKGLQSNILACMWPDYGITSNTLNFWPMPNAAIPVVLYMPQQTTALASTATAISMPPGYQEALTFELAIKCSSKFGAQIPAWLPEAWTDAKANIKAANFPILDARCDAALLHTDRRLGGSVEFYEGR